MTGYIYVGKHSDINIYGKKSTTGNGFYNTIFVHLNKNNKIKLNKTFELAGFNSRSNFYYSFKKMRNTKPKEYYNL